MQKKFRATLEPIGSDLRWVIVRLPFDPTLAWPQRAGLRVQGAIRSSSNTPAFLFRTSLFTATEGGHFLLVNRQMQKGAGVAIGSLAEITLEPDLEERSAAAPAELAKLLKTDRSLKKYYGQLNYSMRKWMADKINQPKSPEARKRCAEQIAEQMLLAMEGEGVPPPVLLAAFRRHSHALEGWHEMTPIQRRSHLLAIVPCQGPEARANRASKAAEEAQVVANRKLKR